MTQKTISNPTLFITRMLNQVLMLCSKLDHHFYLNLDKDLILIPCNFICKLGSPDFISGSVQGILIFSTLKLNANVLSV